MVWLETPTNPLLKLSDIKAASEALKSMRPDIILVVDNTFLTCYFQVSKCRNIQIIKNYSWMYFIKHS